MTAIGRPDRRRFCAALLLSPFVGGCSPFVREGYFFGAKVRMTIPRGESFAAASAAAGDIFAWFADSHRRFHAWRDGETAALNAAIAAGRLPAPLSAPMEKMLRFCAGAEEMSEGLFNPAVGEIVRRWGFHRDAPGENFAPPAESFIRTMAADPPSLRGMEIGGGALRRIHPNARLDFGAVAKGAALDDAGAILMRYEIDNALLDVGGGILALGGNQTRHWRVAMDFGGEAGAADESGGEAAAAPKPFFHGRVIDLRAGEAVATSGASRRFFIHGGKRYHHLIDPRTARPARNPKTAAALGAHPHIAGAEADAAATALALAGDEEARRIIANFGLVAAAVHPPARLWGDMQSRLQSPPG